MGQGMFISAANFSQNQLSATVICAQLPPGHVLSHLAGEAFPDVETVAVGEVSLSDAVRLGTSELRPKSGQF